MTDWEEDEEEDNIEEEEQEGPGSGSPGSGSDEPEPGSYGNYEDPLSDAEGSDTGHGYAEANVEDEDETRPTIPLPLELKTYKHYRPARFTDEATDVKIGEDDEQNRRYIGTFYSRENVRKRLRYETELREDIDQEWCDICASKDRNNPYYQQFVGQILSQEKMARQNGDSAMCDEIVFRDMVEDYNYYVYKKAKLNHLDVPEWTVAKLRRHFGHAGYFDGCRPIESRLLEHEIRTCRAKLEQMRKTGIFYQRPKDTKTYTNLAKSKLEDTFIKQLMELNARYNTALEREKNEVAPSVAAHALVGNRGNMRKRPGRGDDQRIPGAAMQHLVATHEDNSFVEASTNMRKKLGAASRAHNSHNVY